MSRFARLDLSNPEDIPRSKSKIMRSTSPIKIENELENSRIRSVSPFKSSSKYSKDMASEEIKKKYRHTFSSRPTNDYSTDNEEIKSSLKTVDDSTPVEEILSSIKSSAEYSKDIREVKISDEQINSQVEQQEKYEKEFRDKIIATGRRKLHTMIDNVEDISKLSQSEKEKKMVPANISKDILKEIFNMAGSKGMSSFLTLVPMKVAGAKIDLSDIPMSLVQVEEANYTSKGIIVVGLHLVLSDRSPLVIPAYLRDNLETLIISYKSYLYLPTTKQRLEDEDIQTNKKLKIEGHMPNLTSFSTRGKVKLKNLSFLDLSTQLRYLELANSYKLLNTLLNHEKLKYLYLLGLTYLPAMKLSKFVNLRELICYSNIQDENYYFSDIGSIGNLTKLRHLFIHSTKDEKLDFLFNCTKLQSFAIEHYRFTNLNFLSLVPQLESLYIGEARQLTSLLSLKYVPGLKALTILHSNKFEKVEMSVVPHLEEFTTNLTLSRFEDEISSLPSLKLFNLTYNGASTNDSSDEDSWARDSSRTIRLLVKKFPQLEYLTIKSLLHVRLNLLVVLPLLKKVSYTKARKEDVNVLIAKGISVMKISRT